MAAPIFLDRQKLGLEANQSSMRFIFDFLFFPHSAHAIRSADPTART